MLKKMLELVGFLVLAVIVFTLLVKVETFAAEGFVRNLAVDTTVFAIDDASGELQTFVFTQATFPDVYWGVKNPMDGEFVKTLRVMFTLRVTNIVAGTAELAWYKKIPGTLGIKINDDTEVRIWDFGKMRIETVIEPRDDGRINYVVDVYCAGRGSSGWSSGVGIEPETFYKRHAIRSPFLRGSLVSYRSGDDGSWYSRPIICQ